VAAGGHIIFATERFVYGIPVSDINDRLALAHEIL
jgi:hypothetical protein